MSPRERKGPQLERTDEEGYWSGQTEARPDTVEPKAGEVAAPVAPVDPQMRQKRYWPSVPVYPWLGAPEGDKDPKPWGPPIRGLGCSWVRRKVVPRALCTKTQR